VSVAVEVLLLYYAGLYTVVSCTSRYYRNWAGFVFTSSENVWLMDLMRTWLVLSK